MPRIPLTLSLLLTAVIVSAEPARAPGSALERISRFLEDAGLSGLTLSAPDAPGARVTPPLIDQDWDSLPKPDPRILEWLASRIPGLDVSKVRELPLEASVGLLARAVEKKQSAVDLFTDSSLRTDKIYYMSNRSLLAVDAAFELNSLFPFQGTTTSGNPFTLQASVMGNNRIDLLYSRDNFVFRHPVYTEYGGKYQFRSRVIQRIEGPGQLAIEGVWGPWNTVIMGITQVSPTMVKVVTSLKDGIFPVPAIKRRAP